MLAQVTELGQGEQERAETSPPLAPGCHGAAVMIAICVLKVSLLREGHFYVCILAVLGLRRCAGFPLVAWDRGYTSCEQRAAPVAVAASLAAEHRL